MTISEKVAYIQGLFDGLGLDKERPGEARILFEVLDVLKEAGQRLDGMDATMDRFGEELDELRDTVVDLEDAAFDSEDDRDSDPDYSEDDRLQLPCPTCGEDLLVDDEALTAGLVVCPVCGGKFALSFDDERDGSSCEEDMD